jgi:hypothetical protein
MVKVNTTPAVVKATGETMTLELWTHETEILLDVWNLTQRMSQPSWHCRIHASAKQALEQGCVYAQWTYNPQLHAFSTSAVGAGTHWICCLVGPRAGLNDVEKRENTCRSWIEPLYLLGTSRSQSGHRLSYPGPKLHRSATESQAWGNQNVRFRLVMTSVCCSLSQRLSGQTQRTFCLYTRKGFVSMRRNPEIAQCHATMATNCRAWT